MSIGAPIAVPCFAWPFTYSAAGPGVVEQGSDQEILGCVQAILACPIGACPELPTFGIPDPTFQAAPPDAGGVIAAVQQWEDRAQESAIVSALDNTGGSWVIELNTTVTGTGQ